MSDITQITDHVDQAHEKQISWCADKERIRRIVEIICDEIQQLEDVAYDVLINSRLDNATGVILDEYGDLFEEPRGALGDTDYRRVLKVVMGAHQSDGDAVKTIYLHTTLAGVDVWYRQQGRACYKISYDTSTPASADADLEARIERIGEIMRPAGVEYSHVEGDTSSSGNPFRLDTAGQGLDQGELCYRVV